MSENTNPPEDIEVALDTLERRANHLSNRVHQAAGKPPHWRDEVELKALRIAIRSIRRVHKMPDPVELMTEAADSMEAMLASLSANDLEIEDQWNQVLDKLDAFVQANDGP